MFWIFSISLLQILPAVLNSLFHSATSTQGGNDGNMNERFFFKDALWFEIHFVFDFKM